MTGNEEKMVDKIQKLLAKAESTNSVPEAEALYAKAQELMSKWAIDDAMLATRGDMKDEIIEDKIRVASTYFVSDVRLASVIARANYVRILQSKWNNTIHFIGFQSDVKRVQTLFVSLQMQASRFAKMELPAGYKGWDGYVWRRSFRLGFASGIGTRLQDAKRDQEREAQKRSGGSDLLPVLASRKSQVDKYMDDHVPHGKGRASAMKANYEGSASGRRAASRADMGQTRVGGRKSLGR